MNEDDELSQEMRKLLSDFKLPVNKKTTEFVTQFINDHGGVEEFKKEIQNKSQKHAQAPQPPPRLPQSYDCE